MNMTLEEAAGTLELVACNLCESDNYTPYCRVDPFQVVRCNECGLLYTNPRRTGEQTEGLYSEHYFSSANPTALGYDDYAIHAKGLKEVFADNLNIIEKYLRPPASILDVGCAFGYFIEVATSRGWEAEGVEISAFASEEARKRTGATVHTGTLSNASLPASSFHAVTMWDMLEHSLDPSRELSEACRILKPGGYLFMTVPDAGSRIARLMGRHWYGFKSAVEHNYFFSSETISRTLEKAGLVCFETRRGVWPCSMRFLSSKLAPYSKAGARLGGWAVGVLGLGDRTVKFKYIDMFVVAKKDIVS